MRKPISAFAALDILRMNGQRAMYDQMLGDITAAYFRDAEPQPYRQDDPNWIPRAARIAVFKWQNA